jgi:DNA modification methylase
MLMRTFLILKKENLRNIPEAFQTDDNRFPEALVSYFLKNYTKPGDSVLDIFAGLGTTLFVAEQMKRIAYGLEYDKKRVEYIRASLVQKNNVIHGDALKLEDYKLPKIDFCLTSPPYMPKDDDLNPLTGCTTKGDYKQYLKDIRTIFSKVSRILKPNSHVVIEVANLKGNGVTKLAWDIAHEISEILHFEGEIVIGWEQDGDLAQDGAYGYGYDHSYCLVFRNTN